MDNELVFYHNIKDEPYTTSDVIAEFSGVSLRSINKLTNEHKKELEQFGKMRFEIAPMPSGQSRKIWHYNQRQATLFITFMKNTRQVIKFKMALVDEFFEVKKELSEKRVLLERNHQTNKDLSEVIKEHFPDKPFMYSTFHKLAYKVAIDKSPKQVKQSRKVSNAQEALTTDELNKVEHYRTIIANFIELGMDYQQIKQQLTQ
ncbi:phage regulator Rha-like protein [Weissella uvarum]|uniref:Rha family transcriptional regulator n=1 Tax=Weissella uvarum TaxID=1479233 RepID=UPI001960B1FF|nr:Rha family transcriptional regulator [Weissella uvarum]MBM7616690.1 phage regulator Rha-like protein [Weissella uvarum]MCM0594855.1 Rha family transcriptional regulator [Weissella uvarum]